MYACIHTCTCILCCMFSHTHTQTQRRIHHPLSLYSLRSFMNDGFSKQRLCFIYILKYLSKPWAVLSACEYAWTLGPTVYVYMCTCLCGLSINVAEVIIKTVHFQVTCSACCTCMCVLCPITVCELWHMLLQYGGFHTEGAVGGGGGGGGWNCLPPPPQPPPPRKLEYLCSLCSHVTSQHRIPHTCSIPLACIDTNVYAANSCMMLWQCPKTHNCLL